MNINELYALAATLGVKTHSINCTASEAISMDYNGIKVIGIDQKIFKSEYKERDVFTDDEVKYCTRRLKIGAMVNVFDIAKMSVLAFFDWFDFKVKINKAKESTEVSAGNRGAANAGYCGAANAGYRGAANAGDYGAAIARDNSTISVGKCGVAVAMGNGAKAKGKKGSVLVFTEWKNSEIIKTRSVIVDDDKVKSDTFYTLKNGRLKEVK